MNKCAICEKEISEEDTFVLKRGKYENKPLCHEHFNEELEKLLNLKSADNHDWI